MVLPPSLRILQADIKVAYQRRRDFVELDGRHVAARTGVVAETVGDPEFLHLLHGRSLVEPALWVVRVGVFAEACLVAVDEPGVDAQDGAGSEVMACDGETLFGGKFHATPG